MHKTQNSQRISVAADAVAKPEEAEPSEDKAAETGIILEILGDSISYESPYSSDRPYEEFIRCYGKELVSY